MYKKQTDNAQTAAPKPTTEPTTEPSVEPVVKELPEANLPAKVEVRSEDEPEYAVLVSSENEVRDIIKANLGGGFGVSVFDLDRVKVPLGGGTNWQVPTLEGPQSAESFEGIILYYKDQRSFWESTIDKSGGGMPPDCVSADGVMGKGEPGIECANCPNSEWGSSGENRRGQACRTVRMIFLCRPEEIIPCVISIPPSSLRQIKSYFLRLASARIPYYGVVTKFMLQPAKMSGYDVSQIVPVVEQRLEPQEIERAKKLSKELMHVFSKVEAERDDFRSEEGN